MQYQILSETTDYECLLHNFNCKQLKTIRDILEAYPNRIDLQIPRYDDGMVDFCGDFELIIKDKTYQPNGYEILVLKWIEDYENTGCLVEILQEME